MRLLTTTTLSLLSLSHITAAQDTTDAANKNDNALYHLFGSVVYIRSGERTPTSLYTPGPQSLTSLGAQQMHSLGATFRSRYISPSSSSAAFGVQNIQGISPDVLVQDQLSIQTLEKPYLVASAQAFMQGLYPPHSTSSSNQNPDPSVMLGNGSTLDFPLGGYQYANVQVLGSLDARSIYLDGLTNCSAARRANLLYQMEDEYLRTRSAEKAFYANLSSMAWAGSDEESEEVRQARVDYRYATQVYENLSYAFNHDKETYESLRETVGKQDDVLGRARVLADKMAYYSFANTTSSTSDDDDQAMAGKTLAALVLGQLQRIVDKHTLAAKEVDGINAPSLTLLFGDSEPMTSLFDLAMVKNSDDKFKAAPEFGSAMVFELFTLRRDASFPKKDGLADLRVRFYFHNSTTPTSSSNSNSTEAAAGDGLTSFTLFNTPSTSSDTDSPWPTFQDMFQRIMVNQASSWCRLCDSPALFCSGLDGYASPFDRFPKLTDGLGGRGKWNSNVSPAVAGLIGAIVALVVAGVLFGAGMLFGGVRVQRNSSSDHAHRARSFHPTALFGGRFDKKYGSHDSPFASAGGRGFKGSAKLASDPDLSLSGNAAPPAGVGAAVLKGHERVGSWELRQKEVGMRTAESPRASFEGIDERSIGRRAEPVERI